MVFSNRSSNRGGHCRGGAAAELPLLLPLLVFVLIVAIDFCRLFFHYTTITNAARNGALWASDPLANGTVTPSQSPYASFQAAALADANNLNPALTTSDVTSSTGTDGNGNATVSVTVQYQFNMVSTYLGFSNVNLSRQVTMRVAPTAPN
jgi:Flp pilus assembly protein TadG